MATVEFFFDCSSPWTYLAFDRIEELCNDTGAELVWKPILVGGVFNAVNQELYELRAHQNPRKEKYYNQKDLQDWARFYQLQIKFMPTVFPVNSVKAMRGAFVAEEQGKISAYARRVFESYWGDDKDISQNEVLQEIVTGVGMDSAEFFEKIADAAYKDKLRANTEELIEREGFGSPTMYVNGSDMYFGNDRLPLVREAVERAGAET